MSIELPPLHAYHFNLHRCEYRRIEPHHGEQPECYMVADVEARERILMARVAELEADAERYRWLRDNAGVGQGEHVYEQMAYQFEVLTGVSHVSHIYHYAELPSIDAVIDAARGAK